MEDECAAASSCVVLLALVPAGVASAPSPPRGPRPRSARSGRTPRPSAPTTRSPGASSPSCRLGDGHHPFGDRQARRSALDPGPRRPARRCARADPRREGVHRRRQGRRPRAAVAVRHRGRRAPARPAEEPRRAGRRARAAPHRARLPRRGRLLRSPRSSASAAASSSGSKSPRPTFQLPALTDWQHQMLQTAVTLVGYPYVWGGTSDSAQVFGGKSVPGGFDCSGFVWRVYKLQAYPPRTRSRRRSRAARPTR